MINLKSFPKDLSPLARFELNYIPEPMSGCWLWLGRPSGSMNYGSFMMEGRSVRAHRASWILFRSVIPEGRFVLHRCDNPSCVNPDHLFIGTHADNEADKVSKGRQSRGAAHSLAKKNPARGERNGNSRLTPSDIQNIRSFNAPQRLLAKTFGVSQALISKIKRGEIWI